MPEYDYLDENGHIVTMTHRMNYSTAIICVACGSVMWRKPTAGWYVSWGGLKPSEDQQDPVIEKHVNQDFSRIRDKTDEKYRRRENNEWHVNE